MKLIKLLKRLVCKHKDTVSLRVELVRYGYRFGDRIYNKCSNCGKLLVTEDT